MRYGKKRTKLYCDTSIKEELATIYGDGKEHMLEIKRTGERAFDVQVGESSGKRAWLITWNKNKWHWEDFEQNCKATLEGRTVIISWACANSNPQIGEEVFLIKLGEQPRGLIAHGIVARAAYKKEHYDVGKAAAGKSEQAIDVAFDRIINYEKEKYIPQEVLTEKCPAQHWSPQNSGIEIKQETLPNLHELWAAVSKNSEDEWWPSLSEYDPGVTVEEYKNLLQTERIVRRTWLEALHELYEMPDHLGTCKQLGLRYGYPSTHYVSFLSSAAANIVKATRCPMPEDDDNSKYWPVLFQGRRTSDKSEGSYCWKMRKPVQKAIELLIEEGIFTENAKYVEDPVNRFAHNMILYGPPGTGKTYNSVNYAVAICDGRSIEDVKAQSYRETLDRYRELKEAGRIAFTTFHQSYGYEEFIEGIKPKLNTESDAIGYVIEDGVFKAFCKQARVISAKSEKKSLLNESPRIWGMLLGGTEDNVLKRKCFENGEIRFGWGDVEDEAAEGKTEGNGEFSAIAKHQVFDFMHSMKIGDIVVIEKNIRSIDAIGIITGEYEYDSSDANNPRRRNVEWLVTNIDQDIMQYLPNGRKQLSTFYLFPFDYIGMDAVFEILNQHEIGKRVEIKQETRPYVFIIDEINRGNISKIFGELITLIEDRKRAGASEAMEAILPYSGEPFSVPSNVYIECQVINYAEAFIIISVITHEL